ncbi:ABC transporter ATP-binding protein [Castellaniella sp. GW247-6E4]|uniref:ABC transporter ATP-binding protein n=1 Tax=Castellaniella sp. GW247-6E4 TaxID=3140380 RepID=UPI003314D608
MLRVQNLKVEYGSIAALRGVSFDIPDGAIVALIGANGAGKTTTLNTICGLISPREGSIEWDHEDIAGLPPHKVIRRGIVQVPEGRKVFQNLTVYECLLMGTLVRTDKKAIKRDIERMYEIFPRLAERRHQLTQTLSGGEQQMVAFARALLAQPRLLLLDEPSMGLAPQIVEDVMEQIMGVNEKGVTVLLVEQNAEMALQISDCGYVLETGEIALRGTGEELLADERVREAYLGV